jgi:hypothetical protein
MRRSTLFLAAGLMACGLTGAAAEPAGEGVADLGSYAARVEIHPFESLTLTDRQFLTGSPEEAKPVTVTGCPSSDDLRRFGMPRNGGSGPPGLRG